MIGALLDARSYRHLAQTNTRTRQRLMDDDALRAAEKRYHYVGAELFVFGGWLAHAGNPFVRNATGTWVRDIYTCRATTAAIAVQHLRVDLSSSGREWIHERLRGWLAERTGLGARVLQHVSADMIVGTVRPLQRDLQNVKPRSIIAALPLKTAVAVMCHIDARRSSGMIVDFLTKREIHEYRAIFADNNVLAKYVRRYGKKFYTTAQYLDEKQQLALLAALPPHLDEWLLAGVTPYRLVIVMMMTRRIIDIVAEGPRLLHAAIKRYQLDTVEYLVRTYAHIPFTPELVAYAFSPEHAELWDFIRADPRFVPTH